VYLWSTGGSGRACCTAAVLIGRLYGVSAGEALARVQYSVAARLHQVLYKHKELLSVYCNINQSVHDSSCA
jgi:hypothetical protein